MTAVPARAGAGQASTLALVLLVSITVLAQEVALLRVLAIAHWHHAAQTIIAVALCAFGAAATAIAVFPKLEHRSAAHAAAAAYAVSIPAALWLASSIRFNALAVGWESSQWVRLLALQAIFVASIGLGALSIQICLARAGPRIGSTYGINLLGSGLGALAVLPLLTLGAPEKVLGALALLPALAAVPRMPKIGAAAILLVVLIPSVEFEMTAYKTLPMVRALPDAVVSETRFRAHARIDVVHAPSLRPVAGLSLGSATPVPAMGLVTVDGEAAGPLLAGSAEFFADTLSAAPLAFIDRPHALVLGGAGNLHEAALGAERVRRVDIAWTGENPRAYLAHTEERFDIVWLHVPRRVAMSENALATREAFAAALGVTTERGVVFVTVPINTPPREELKVIRTALAVTRYVEAVRSLDLLGVMLRRRPFAADEERQLAAFLGTRGFDRIDSGERLHESGHRAYLSALSGDVPAGRYRSDPASDDSPYFHRFLRWSRLPDAVTDAGGLGAAQVDWGTLVALVATVQVTLLGCVLIVVPLMFRRGAPSPPRERRFALWHFLAIGCAYAAIEMAFLGRLTLVLGSPEYAAGIVLCAFLVASGIGSFTGARARTGAWLAAAVAMLAAALLDTVASLPLAVAMACVVALPMGIPFPAGLRRLHERAPALVPWALAVNGCASVAAFSAAPLVASDLGFSGLIVVGAILYLAVGAADRAGARRVGD